MHWLTKIIRRFRRKRASRISLHHRIMIHDKNGNLVRDTGFVPSHSWTEKFLEMFYCRLATADLAGVDDTGGTTRTLDYDTTQAGNYYCMTLGDLAGNQANEGIVVGSGTTAEDIDDDALATIIAHGTGSGQLTYGSTALGVPASASGSTTMTLTRTFNNGSGASIDVKEIGIYMRFYYTTATLGYFCIARDVLGATEAVANGQTLTVVYTLTTSN